MFWQLFFGFGSTGSQKKDDPCEAGCTAVTLKDARFTAEELRDGGCTAEELRDAGFSAWDLKDFFLYSCWFSIYTREGCFFLFAQLSKTIKAYGGLLKQLLLLRIPRKRSTDKIMLFFLFSLDFWF